MMSASWVSVKIMVPSECRPTEFLPTARPPELRFPKHVFVFTIQKICVPFIYMQCKSNILVQKHIFLAC